MLEEFLSWWGQNLLACVPERWRVPARPRDALIAEMLPGEDALALIARRQGRVRTLGQFTPGSQALRVAVARRRVHIRLPPGLLLQRTVELPAAAERELDRVLRYEMDRLTPFGPDEVYWGWSLTTRDRARGRLHIGLRLVLRSTVAPALSALTRAGALPTALESPDAPGLIPLDPAHPSRARSRRHALTAAAIACAALSIAAIALPFLRQEFAARAIERRITALQPLVGRVEATRRQFATGAAGLGVLAAQQAQTGNALATLATLTQILPDGTFLTELTLRGHALALTGQSTDAARLIPILSASPAVQNPAFAAPVTRNEAAHTEGFQIRAGIAP